MSSARAEWDFDYRSASGWSAAGPPIRAVVVAFEEHVSAERVRAALVEETGGEPAVEPILARPPLFWLRVTSSEPLDVDRLAAALSGLGGGVRYVTPSQLGSQAWAPALRTPRAAVARPEGWAVRGDTTAAESRDGGHWFLSSKGGGVATERAATGTGAGSRLAVIDDDAAGAGALDLDAEVLLGVPTAPRAQAHGAQMVGWAVGAPRASPPFRGVAPDASPRLYLIPKPGTDVVALPCAIVRAVSDGADVVVCATYIEGSWSPMLDDALAFAERLGRGGLGAVVVFPTGRETSSAPGSVHASLTLSFGDPAADPRALCVAPAARASGWFFYRDRKGKARPFANRGPSVRFLAPGDDIAWPLGDGGRLCHAESSGASAIAAGVVLLVLAQNPTLRLHEVFALLEATVEAVPPEVDPAQAPFADLHDTRPSVRDRDGHNAKHGYGALHAERACLAAADPVAWALVRIGELGAARTFVGLRRGEPLVREAYSNTLACWVVRALLVDARSSHAARALARHARLLAADPRRLRGFPPGSFAKQLALLLRGLLERTALGQAPPSIAPEIRDALARLARDAPAVEQAWVALATRLFQEVGGSGLP